VVQGGGDEKREAKGEQAERQAKGVDGTHVLVVTSLESLDSNTCRKEGEVSKPFGRKGGKC
jgi:hypothetical protein